MKEIAKTSMYAIVEKKNSIAYIYIVLKRILIKEKAKEHIYVCMAEK